VGLLSPRESYRCELHPPIRHGWRCYEVPPFVGSGWAAGAGLREGAELLVEVRDGEAGAMGGLRLGWVGAGAGVVASGDGAAGAMGGLRLGWAGAGVGASGDAVAGSSGGFVFGGSTGLVSSGSV
jgi:hypothetical protein